MQLRHIARSLFLATSLIARCPQPALAPPPSPLVPPEPRTAVADETARIPVLMYHAIACGPSRYDVCPDSLYAQLASLHELGFRAVSVDEYLAGDFSRLSIGEKPYLITFDDSSRSQLFFDDSGTPQAQSAVGVIERFRDDYGVRVPATFFVLTAAPLFANAREELAAVAHLATNDFTIANHTARHTDLTGASLEKALAAFGSAEETLAYLAGSERGGARVGAYPFGGLPSAVTRDALLSALGYDALFHAYGGLAAQPGTEAFDPGAINRYETHGTSSEPGGIGWFLPRYPLATLERVTQR